jgi:hypothetical protein
MLKKAGVATGLLILAACAGWGQTFDLPVINNTIESVQTAFRRLIENTAQMGFIDYDSSWENNSERFKMYLDGVLNTMAYSHVRIYVERINASIQSIDYMEISRRQQTEFEDFLSNARAYSLFANVEDSRYDTQEDREKKNRLRPVWAKVNNFQTWVDFFKNENTAIRDFLILQKNKDGLYRMINEIPQRYVADYEKRLEVFCAEWGI